MTVDLYLGDCLEILPRIEAGSVDAVITDPPYREGWNRAFEPARATLGLNGQILWCIYPTEIWTMPPSKQVLTWLEPSSPKKMYRQYWLFFDLILWYAYGEYTFNPMLWNLMDGKFKDEVIEYKRSHQWQKPLSLIQKLIMIHTNPGDTVLDPFMGSGTTGVACVQTGRNFIGIEIDPAYYAIAEKRIAEAQMQPMLEGLT